MSKASLYNPRSNADCASMSLASPDQLDKGFFVIALNSLGHSASIQPTSHANCTSARLLSTTQSNSCLSAFKIEIASCICEQEVVICRVCPSEPLTIIFSSW